MLDSIGSRVKLTNSDTSTATATVMPNGKKNLPTMPFMNATGTNTAQIAKVVAITARPISSVPLRRLAMALAQVHMADDVLPHHDRVVDQRPMHSDSAIIVMKFSVKPNR